MDTKNISSFYVAGISLRTNNTIELSNAARIPALWGRFYAEGIAEKFHDRIGDEIYVVYSDYESDHTGEYTYTIGVMVQHPQHITGIDVKEIKHGTYAVFESPRGQMAHIMFDVWQRIWRSEENELKDKRLYHTDFEVHDPKKIHSLDDAQVTVYIGLK